MYCNEKTIELLTLVPMPINPTLPAFRLRYQLDMFLGDQIQDSIRDKSQLTLIRPLDRGYVLNWEAEVSLAARVLSMELVSNLFD